MTRIILMKPKNDFEPGLINKVERQVANEGLQLQVDKFLRIGRHDFDAFVNPYPNGYKNGGMIVYLKGHVRVPIGKRLLTFVNAELTTGMPPKGIATIDYVVRCQLNELTEDEWLRRGFKNKKDFMDGMTKNTDRCYKGLRYPSDVVQYYSIPSFNPNPDANEVHALAELAGLDFSQW